MLCGGILGGKVGKRGGLGYRCGNLGLYGRGRSLRIVLEHLNMFRNAEARSVEWLSGAIIVGHYTKYF